MYRAFFIGVAFLKVLFSVVSFGASIAFDNRRLFARLNVHSACGGLQIPAAIFAATVPLMHGA